MTNFLTITRVVSLAAGTVTTAVSIPAAPAIILAVGVAAGVAYLGYNSKTNINYNK